MEVAGAQAAHLNHSSILKPLVFLGELLCLSAFCSQFVKWNSCLLSQWQWYHCES